MTAAVRKFTFDTVFTEDGRVLRASEAERASFTPEELAEARAAAFEEGQRSAVAQAEHASAAAAQVIADNMAHLVTQMAGVASGLRRDAVELALAAATAAADAALARCPEEAVAGLFEECSESLRGAPFVVVRAPEATHAMIRDRLGEPLARAGLAPDALRLEGGDGPVRLEWSVGAACMDPEFALAQAREAAERWLAAQDADADQLSLFAEP